MRKGDLKHILLSLAITAIVGFVLLLFWHSAWILLIAWLSSVLCGVAKEFYDVHKGGDFEQSDLLMDIVGATFGIPILFIIAMII